MCKNIFASLAVKSALSRLSKLNRRCSAERWASLTAATADAKAPHVCRRSLIGKWEETLILSFLRIFRTHYYCRGELMYSVETIGWNPSCFTGAPVHKSQENEKMYDESSHRKLYILKLPHRNNIQSLFFSESLSSSIRLCPRFPVFIFRTW